MLATAVFAQMHNGKFGNEWINHSQSYYKVKIVEDGIYRLDKQILNRDIQNFNQISSQHLQLYCLGEQIPVYVHTVNGTVEYIEFYAERNKGQLDANLYKKPHHHFNPSYSLITDTASYFLTWSANSISQQYQNQSSNFNNLPPKEASFTYKAEKTFINSWNPGKINAITGYNFTKGSYEFGEGYGSSFVQQQEVIINSPYANTASPTATIKIRGYASGNHSHLLQVTAGNTSQLFQQFNTDSVYSVSLNVPVSTISSNATTVNISGTGGSGDKHSLSTVSISYPRDFNFGGASIFRFEIASGNRKYLEINNFDGGPATSQQVYLYDISNKLRILCYWDGTLLRAELPASTAKRQLVLVNEQETENIHLLHKTLFKNYTIARGDYIVISHPDLYRDSEGRNPIFDYCAYRTTTGEKPSMHSITELYDQFAYGIAGHPLAIRNFAAYIKQHWISIKPKNIFLIGKGRIYTAVRQNPRPEHLIPTFGYPPSDNLLLAQNNSNVPMIPVGRLAATTADEVSLYLKKIKQMESGATDILDYDNQHWRKQIIHLGGGKTNFEQSLIKINLEVCKNQVYNSKTGSKVHSFYKNSSEYSFVPHSKLIDSLINKGVSMITFMGHGSTNGFDYYINNLSNFNNKNKYPSILSLSCSNGSIYENTRLMSEKFLFEKDAGASSYIGFTGPLGLSYASLLSESYYKNIHTDMYGEGIGAIIQQSLADLNNSSIADLWKQITSNYLVFHGDPALKFNYKSSPDYFISPATITTSPEIINSDMRNFKLLIDVHNWGLYKDTTLRMKIVRTHPFGTTDSCYVTIKSPKDKEHISLSKGINFAIRCCCPDKSLTGMFT